MDTKTTGQVAAELGTTVPRVHRALTRLGIQPERTPGGHLKLNHDDLLQLTDELGRVPKIDGLRREQVLVLAALARRPIGLISARAAARAAGVSPTAASFALSSLAEQDYIEQVELTAVEGRVHSITLWRVKWTSAQWRGVAPLLARTVLPHANRVIPSNGLLPRRLAHLFWDVPNPAAIDLRASGSTVANRILSSTDPQALSWAATGLSPSDLIAGAQFRNVDDRVRSLAQNLAR